MGERKKPATARKVNLPGDIEENILSRLPVKTIVRFRSVCKSWYSLVLDPCFINMHQKTKPIHNNLFVAFLTKNKDIVVADTASVVHSRLVVKSREIFKEIGGCCDGIVCVYGTCCCDVDYYRFREYIILWNPALRIIKCIDIRLRCLVPDPHVGFGFHNHSNDYKVIRFETTSSVAYHTASSIKQVEIYSLSSGSWRTIKADLPPRMINTIYFEVRHASGVYVNGAHYWSVGIVENDDDSPNKKIHSGIISFDMGDEVFKEIMLPTECLRRQVILFNYKDSLSMLVFEGSKNELCHIWVMKEYESTWTKQCKVDMTPRYGRLYLVGRGIIQQEDNKIVLKSLGNLQQPPVVFDIDKLQMKDTDSCYTANLQILKDAIEASTFTQSLLLIN